MEVGSAEIVTAGEGFVLIFGFITKKFPDFQGSTMTGPEVTDVRKKTVTVSVAVPPGPWAVIV
jgi:hypothetical protein